MAFFIAGFALIFIPLSYRNPTVIFSILLVICYICVHFTLTFTSKIIVREGGELAVSIPGHATNRNQYIAFKDITHVEICDYKFLNRQPYYPQGVNRDYYYTVGLLAYTGPGLIVCYDYSKSMSGDQIVRGVCFPSPRASEFSTFIKAHVPN